MRCVTLFYNLMKAETSSGAVYASTRGLTLNASGEVDYASLVALDREGPFIAQGQPVERVAAFCRRRADHQRRARRMCRSCWQATYIITIKNLRSVWVYRDRVTGVYTAATPSAAQPTGVTVAGVQLQRGQLVGRLCAVRHG